MSTLEQRRLSFSTPRHLGSKDSYITAFGPKDHTILLGFWAILMLRVRGCGFGTLGFVALGF